MFNAGRGAKRKQGDEENKEIESPKKQKAEEDEDRFFCPITRQIFFNPVKLDCNHVFEQEHIIEWSSSESTCPLCRCEFGVVPDKVDRELKHEITDRIRANHALLKDQFVSVSIVKQLVKKKIAYEFFENLLIQKDPTEISDCWELILGMSDNSFKNFFENVIARWPNFPDAYVGYSRILREEKQFDSALSVINRVIKMHPENYLAIQERGIIFFHTVKYEDAIRDFNFSLLREPDDYYILTYRGASFYLIDQYDNALIDLDKGLLIEPDDSFALGYRAAVLYQQDGQEHKALEDANRAIQINPENYIAKGFRGEILFYFERYEDALIDFTAVLERCPGDKPTLSIRAAVFYHLGRLNDAEADLERLLKVVKPTSFELGYRGAIREARGNFTGALEDYKAALQQDPENNFAKDRQGKLMTKMNAMEQEEKQSSDQSQNRSFRK